MILAVVSGIHTVEIKKDILYLFPIITKRYWFVTIYIVLCLLSPILNYVIHILNQKQFRILMGLFLVLFYLIPVISYTVNAPTITGDSGYGIVNFICLYFVGRYIRIYDCHAKRIWASVGFLASCLMMFLANHAMSLLMGFYFNSYVSYDTIFTLAGATFLFLWCQEWNFQSAIINKIAEYSFSVYIIHMSMFYGTIIFQKAVEISENTTLWYVVLFVVPILFYAVSIVLESIRRVVFNKLDSKLVKVTSRGMIGKFLDTQLKEFIEGYNGYGIK